METTSTAEIGKAGEQLAIKWLRERGYLIHHVNWRDGYYELDIVARKMGVLHFIEVKTRKLGSLTTPEDAMTPKKVKAFVKATQAYLRQYRIWYDIQLDFIAVETKKYGDWDVRFVENAVEFHW